MQNINANRVFHLRNEYINKIFTIVREENLEGKLLSIKDGLEFPCLQLVPTYGADENIIRYENFMAYEIEIDTNVYILGDNSEGKTDSIVLMDLNIMEISRVLDILENKLYN